MKKLPDFGRRLAAILAATSACFAADLAAQTTVPSAYPTRTVTIVVPTAAAGPTDLIARAIAEPLRRAWNQSVVVENRPGASAIIGTEVVAKSPPDGYTLLLGYTAHIQAISLFKKLPYDPLNGFAAVTQICAAPLAFVVRESDGPRSLAAFVTQAKASPESLNYGNWGIASSGHLYGELLNRVAGIKATNAGYKGVAAIVNDILGGHITGAILDMAVTRPHVLSGRLRPIAVTGVRRSLLMPEVPTFAELGYPGFEPVGWFGVLAPARTPAEIVSRVAGDVRAALAAPQLAENFKQLGLEIVGGTPEQFSAVMREDTVKWAKLIREAGIQPE